MTIPVKMLSTPNRVNQIQIYALPQRLKISIHYPLPFKGENDVDSESITFTKYIGIGHDGRIHASDHIRPGDGHYANAEHS